MNKTYLSERHIRTRLAAIARELDRIRVQFAAIGDLRPGTLTRQYHDPAQRRGAYWQLSYTRQMKSRTDYIRPGAVATVRRQVANYKRFKLLVERRIELGIEQSKLSMRLPDSGSCGGRVRT